MKFIIRFYVYDYEDSFIVEGETIQEIRDKADSFFIARGLDSNTVGAWSEEVQNDNKG